QKEFSEKIISTSNAIIVGLDKNHKIRLFNEGAEQITGYKIKDVMGKDWFKMFFMPELLDEMNKVWKKAWGIKFHSYINPIRTKNGEKRIISWQTTGLYEGEDEKKHIMISTGEDITERKQAEKELEKHREHLEELVEKRTEELKEKTDKIEESRKALTYLIEDVNEAGEELRKANMEYSAANKELKEFAYIVSHDLKAPLRAISQLTHWISEDYSEAFDDNGKMQMDLIIKRVKRMDSLIDGILRYSRVGRIREKEEHLDLNLLVNEVVDNIVPPDNVQIIFENKLPVVFRDSIRMEQVFQNLIGNAIKFMDKGDGIIKVGCADEGASWKFSVSDNGPGINKKYHDKIFRIFQTLTPRDAHESTGIGLTLVKKIIKLYGGSVWVESETGRGTTFFFTLPKKGEKDEKL
ncbi:MAG: PAS domain S-box protein, partial [Desulfobacterales bacterium]|nr:PAS domain S-box protein [Desulfobacterales bacterium]